MISYGLGDVKDEEKPVMVSARRKVRTENVSHEVCPVNYPGKGKEKIGHRI